MNLCFDGIILEPYLSCILQMSTLANDVLLFRSNLMVECWQDDKDTRRTFKELVEILDKIIELHTSSEVMKTSLNYCWLLVLNVHERHKKCWKSSIVFTFGCVSRLVHAIMRTIPTCFLVTLRN